MSDSNSSKNSQIELYLSKGLSEEEANALSQHSESGKPNLAKVRSDALATMYNLGYNCKQLYEMFPEYTFGSIVHAKISHEWDESKKELQSHLESSVIDRAKLMKNDSIQFLSEIVMATHVKWRKDLMRFLANPDREKAPDCLPNSLSQYKDTVETLTELSSLNPNSSTKSNTNPSVSTQLLSVNINNVTKESTEKTTMIDVKDVKDNRAASLLQKRAKEIKDGQK